MRSGDRGRRCTAACRAACLAVAVCVLAPRECWNTSSFSTPRRAPGRRRTMRRGPISSWPASVWPARAGSSGSSSARPPRSGAPACRPLLWQVVLAILLALMTVNGVLKPALARSRPFEVIRDSRVVGVRPATYSFPSGHAASAVAGAFVTTLMLPRGRVLLWALAALIAASRVYVGVHYPLDVAVGALVGGAVGVLVTGGRAWYIQTPSAAQHQWRGSSVGRAPD